MSFSYAEVKRFKQLTTAGIDAVLEHIIGTRDNECLDYRSITLGVPSDVISKVTEAAVLQMGIQSIYSRITDFIEIKGFAGIMLTYLRHPIEFKRDQGFWVEVVKTEVALLELMACQEDPLEAAMLRLDPDIQVGKQFVQNPSIIIGMGG